MCFKERYDRSVSVQRMVNMDLHADFLIPNLYQYDLSSPADDCEIPFLHLLAGGSLRADFPLSFRFRPLPCFLLLDTVKGGGYITQAGTPFS